MIFSFSNSILVGIYRIKSNYGCQTPRWYWTHLAALAATRFNSSMTLIKVSSLLFVLFHSSNISFLFKPQFITWISTTRMWHLRAITPACTACVTTSTLWRATFLTSNPGTSMPLNPIQYDINYSGTFFCLEKEQKFPFRTSF